MQKVALYIATLLRHMTHSRPESPAPSSPSSRYTLPYITYSKASAKEWSCSAVRSEKSVIETSDYSPWFSNRNWNYFGIDKKRTPCESTSQRKKNGSNFSFIQPSSMEYKDHKK